jgi:hypothetical protein
VNEDTSPAFSLTLARSDAKYGDVVVSEQDSRYLGPELHLKLISWPLVPYKINISAINATCSLKDKTALTSERMSVIWLFVCDM